MLRSRHFSRIQAIAPFTGEGFFVFGSKLLLWRLQCQVHSWTQYDDDFENVLHKDNDDDGDDDDADDDDDQQCVSKKDQGVKLPGGTSLVESPGALQPYTHLYTALYKPVIFTTFYTNHSVFE